MNEIRPDDIRYQTFFDLLTGYRASELLRVSVRCGLYDAIGEEGSPLEEILRATGWKASPGERILSALITLGLLGRCGDTFYLSPLSRRFLLSTSPDNQMAALLFEERLVKRWGTLESQVKSGKRVALTKSPEEYNDSLRLFLKAMDSAARCRSRELWAICPLKPSGRILEAGAGSGAYLALFLEENPGWEGLFCDLADVVEIARIDPRLQALKERVTFLSTNLLSETIGAGQGTIDLLLLSNLIHCQGEEETAGILARVLPLLASDGTLLIHDFFHGENPDAALYDLHMMLNTYNGRTYTPAKIAGMLKGFGLVHTAAFTLPSSSTALFASQTSSALPRMDPLAGIKRRSRELGFTSALVINPAKIPVRSWVAAKCEFGCRHFGRCHTCPPRSLSPEEMRALLGEFTSALLLVGPPPLAEYQGKLIQLEQFAFESSFQGALAFSSGPCALCPECDLAACRFPEKRRPSLEACGADVYGLCAEGGLPLHPPSEANSYIQYVSLLLLEERRE